MSRGPLGYGRYDDDPDCVGCPRAASDMTPCIARDGALALDDERKPGASCVGCGALPRRLLAELQDALLPEAEIPKLQPRDYAVGVQRMVLTATAPEPPDVG